MNRLFTLSEFINAFGNIDKIKAIYVDNDKDELRSKLENLVKPFDVLHKYDNLLNDDCYLTLENGDYTINKEKVISDYANYRVSRYFPIINPEYVDIVNHMHETMDDPEYACHIAQYSYGCEVIIRPPKTSESIDPEFFPKMNSGVNCLVLLDYRNIDSTDEPIETIIGVLPDDTRLIEILSQRKLLCTAVFNIVNGEVDVDNSSLYYTDENGFTKNLGGFDTYDIHMGDEEEGEQNDNK